jgi:hypothetical protein
MEVPGFFLNVSGFLLATLCALSPEFGPVLVAKCYAPAGLLVLGLSMVLLLHALRFRSWVCLLGGLAAGLNSYAFSIACWGLPTWPLSWAMNLLAVAALVTPAIRQWWLKASLAGFAVGLGVMEGTDVGVIFSIFTGVFAILYGIKSGTPVALKQKMWPVFRVVAIMVTCAFLIAPQFIYVVVSSQVKGITGMAQDESTKAKRWDEATQWSLPKIETLRVFIPGLFGYRMPELYGEPPTSEGGGNYWGAVGQSPGVIQSRHSGAGVYAGVLVVLIALWGLAQSFTRKGGAYTRQEQVQIRLWGLLLLVALALAWGRHAPFYRIVYALPYVSTVRNPIKLVFPFSMALLILFGFGLEGIARLYLDKARARAGGLSDQLKSWWKTAASFDRKWTIACICAVAASLLGWLIYSSSNSALAGFLKEAGFPEAAYPGLAESIARFSLHEFGVYVGFLTVSVAILILAAAGAFGGIRAKWFVLALGVLLTADLSRADVPWIRYWDYKFKYASNPIIDQLRQTSFEQRVTAELMPMSREWMIEKTEEGAWFARLYFEWLQHPFPYFAVRSLDINQMPRVPQMDSDFLRAFRPSKESELSRCGRLWMLTNTRYALGSTAWLDILNNHVDPGRGRFRVHTAFRLAPKPGVTTATREEQLTAVADPKGPFALFEFTGALPRAKLFSQWTVNTNDESTLAMLVDRAFDPSERVLVANDVPPPQVAPSGTNAVVGTVQLVLPPDHRRPDPKRVTLKTDSAVASILLLNDHYHPDWTVTVDGKKEPLLRCNFIMRGVYLPAGKHLVEFRFQPPATSFYVSLSSLIVALGLCLYAGIVSRRSIEPSPPTSAGSQTSMAKPRKGK